MSIVKLKIDVSGTIADEAWREIKQFDQIQSADFGPNSAAAAAAITLPMLLTARANGSEPRSTSRRRFWPSMRSRTIWSKSEYSTLMSWRSDYPVCKSNPGAPHRCSTAQARHVPHSETSLLSDRVADLPHAVPVLVEHMVWTETL